LVFDSKVTTGAGLAALEAEGITFLTLRARNAKLTGTLEALADTAWTTITSNRRGAHNRPQVHEDTVTVQGCPVPLRQIAVRGLGHDHPTLILTNDRFNKPADLVERYAHRMTIEQRLKGAIRSFRLDALSSAVALNVDLDTTLTVAAQLAYDWLRRRLPGYETATPDTIWRRFISTKGSVVLGPARSSRVSVSAPTHRCYARRASHDRSPLVGRSASPVRAPARQAKEARIRCSRIRANGR
jgi:hypothetical protein